MHLCLHPYLTLPYGEDVLPPSTEASNRPNAHPQINCKVTKSPTAILTWSIPIPGTIPSLEGPTHVNLLTNMYSWYLQENISSKAHKSTSILVTMTRDPLRRQATRTVPGNFSNPMCRVLRATQIPFYSGSTSPVSQTDAPNI